MKRLLKNKYTYIVAILILFVLYITYNVVSICLYSNVDETTRCDVGIVLGAATNDDGISEVYRQRLNHAIELYQNNYIAKIIVTGGKGKGNHNSDAYIAKLYLEEEGIPSDAILLEETSTITQENIANSKIIMDENRYQSALIISDPLHMKRSMLLAADADITAFSSPTQSSAYKSLRTKIPFVIRETFFYAGYKWYRHFSSLSVIHF